jgi:hypothetical protein
MGERVDLSSIAKRLRTRVVWVEHCLRTYGRRAYRPGSENAEGREDMLERMEEEEVDEAMGEDEEDVDLRQTTRDKQRILRLKKTPTPGGLKDF